MIATGRHARINRRASRSALAAVSMTLLGCWIWGSTASADDGGAVRELAPIDSLTTGMSALGEDMVEDDEGTAPEGADTGPAGTSAFAEPPEEGSELASFEEVGVAFAAEVQTIRDEASSSSSVGQPHPETVISGGDQEASRSDLTQPDATEEHAVEAPAVDAPVEMGAWDVGEISVAAPPEPATDRSVAPHQDGSFGRFTGPASRFDQTAIAGGSDVHAQRFEEKPSQSRTSGGGEGRTAWPSSGVRSANITTGVDSPPGSIPVPAEALFAKAVSAAGGMLQNFDGPLAAGVVPGSLLAVGAGVIALSGGGRLRTNTIQGAVSGAGPPRPARSSPVPPAAHDGGVPVARPTRPYPTPNLPSLASIRRPHPASRWQGLFVGPSLVMAGEQRPRWQRLHCALSPPRGRCRPVQSEH